MAGIEWLLFDSGEMSPYLNMAVDEVLLKKWSGPVLVRLYAWNPPGLSLGYFQRFKEMQPLEVVRGCGAQITRRITGGDAILHIHELTYSMVGEEGVFPFHGSVESSYHRIHMALAAGFEQWGIQSQIREPAALEVDPAVTPAGCCFYRVTRYDLVARGVKLVGSAQRRTLGKVLHHGSIPLDQNPMTPESADLSSLAGKAITYQAAAAAVCHGMEKELGVSLVPWKPPPPLIEEAEHLAAAKYGAPEWIQRR